MIEIISGIWAAGEVKTFMVNGEYLEVLDAQYPIDIMLMDKAGSQLSIMKQSEASFFSRPKEGYQTIQITSAQAQFIRVFCGSGDAGTRRISSTVQVVDGERARTNAGVMFAASGTQAAVAAQAGRIELWNPVGSGKRLVVGALSMSAAAGATLNVCYSTVAEATDLTANFVLNKLLAQPVGAAKLLTGSNAAIFTQSMFGSAVAASQLLPWTPKGVIVINPGIGLMVFSGTLNVTISANFEWFEETIA